jgi:hypothetical protein
MSPHAHQPVQQSKAAVCDTEAIGFTTVARASRLIGQPAVVSKSFEVILLPDETDTDHVFTSNVLWERAGQAALQEVRRVRIVFLE